MLPNFNPAFPTPQHIPLNHPFPPGFPLQPRLPIPPPPGISQPQPTSLSDTSRSNHSTNVSETDSLDRPSSPSHMDTSTNAELGTPSSITQKPSALSSLLEFGTLPPPSNLGDIRPTGAPPNPFPFPFVTPGPGVPFSPQAAAGMTTYYRPSFSVPPTTTPLDISQQSLATPSQTAPKSTPTKSKKKTAAKKNSTEVISQNILDEPSPPKKKPRKTNPRGKGKAKKNETDGENDADEDNKSPPPPPPTTTKNKKKKRLKKDTKDNTTTDDTDETKVTNGTINSTSHNLLAQMGLMNNSLMQPTATPLLQSSSSTNGTNPTPNAQHQQQQQAQIAAMYNMTPHFAAYNTFPGPYNPSFPGATYPGGYPPPYGFHPAFGNSPTGQPFPFMPPTPTSTTSSINT
jgi:hypothetical protein